MIALILVPIVNNDFIKALGLVALCYLLFQAIAWAFNSLAIITRGFTYWVNYSLLPWADEAAIAIGVIFLLVTAATSRKSNF